MAIKIVLIAKRTKAWKEAIKNVLEESCTCLQIPISSFIGIHRCTGKHARNITSLSVAARLLAIVCWFNTSSFSCVSNSSIPSKGTINIRYTVEASSMYDSRPLMCSNWIGSMMMRRRRRMTMNEWERREKGKESTHNKQIRLQFHMRSNEWLKASRNRKK